MTMECPMWLMRIQLARSRAAACQLANLSVLPLANRRAAADGIGETLRRVLAEAIRIRSGDCAPRIAGFR